MTTLHVTLLQVARGTTEFNLAKHVITEVQKMTLECHATDDISDDSWLPGLGYILGGKSRVLRGNVGAGGNSLLRILKLFKYRPTLPHCH